MTPTEEHLGGRWAAAGGSGSPRIHSCSQDWKERLIGEHGEQGEGGGCENEGNAERAVSKRGGEEGWRMKSAKET